VSADTLIKITLMFLYLILRRVPQDTPIGITICIALFGLFSYKRIGKERFSNPRSRAFAAFMKQAAIFINFLSANKRVANTRVGALIVLMLLASAVFAQTQPSATDRTLISMAATSVSGQVQTYKVAVHAYTISETYYRKIDDLPALQNQLDQILNDGYTDPASIEDKYDIELNNLARSPVYFYVDGKPAPNCPGAVLTDDSGMASCIISMDPAVTGKEYCLPVKSEFLGSAGAKPAITSTTLCPDNPKPTRGIGEAISSELQKPQSAMACLPLVLVLGFLISAMYFAGKNPLGLFDITTPRLPQPKVMKMGRTSFFAEWKIMNRELMLQQAAYKLAMGQTLADLAKRMGNSKWNDVFGKAVANKDTTTLKKLAADIRSAAKTREQIEGATLFRKATDQYVWSLATQQSLTALNAPPDWITKNKAGKPSFFDAKILKRMGFVRGAVGNVTYNMRIVGGVGKALAVETKAAHGVRNLVGLVSAKGAANIEKWIQGGSVDKKVVIGLTDPIRIMDKQKKDLEKAIYLELAGALYGAALNGKRAKGKEEEIKKAFDDALMNRFDDKNKFMDRILAIARGYVAKDDMAKFDSAIRSTLRELNKINSGPGPEYKKFEEIYRKLSLDPKKGGFDFGFFAGGREGRDLPMFAMIKDLESNLRQTKPRPGETKEQMMGRLTKELRDYSEKSTGKLVMLEYMRQLEIAKAEGRTRKEDLAKIDLKKVEAYVRLTMLAEQYSMAFPLADKREGKAYSKFAAEAVKVLGKLGVSISPEKLQAQLSPDTLREIKDKSGKSIFAGIDTSYAWKSGDRDLRRGIDAYVDGMFKYGVKSRDVSLELASAMLYANRLQGRLDDHVPDAYGKQAKYNVDRNLNMLTEMARRAGIIKETGTLKEFESVKDGVKRLNDYVSKGLSYSEMKKGVWVTSPDGTATPYFVNGRDGKRLNANEMMRVSEFDKIVNGIILYQDDNGRWSRLTQKHLALKGLPPDEREALRGRELEYLYDKQKIQIVPKDEYGKAWDKSANPLLAWGAKQYRGVAGFFERVTYAGFADTAQKYKDFMDSSSINHTTYWNIRQDMQLGKYDKFLGHTSGGLSPVARFIGAKSAIGEPSDRDFNLGNVKFQDNLQKEVARYGQSASPYWYAYKDIITRDPRIGSTAYGMQAMFPGLYMYGQGVMSSPKGYEGGVGARYFGFKETFIDGFKQGIKPGGNWTTFNAGVSNIVQKSRMLMLPSYHASALATALVRTPEMLIMGWPAHHDEHESTKGRYVEAAKSIFRPWALHDMADSWKIPKWEGAKETSFTGGPVFKSPTKWWGFGYGGTEEHNIQSGKLKGGTFFTDMPFIGKGLQRALGTGWHVQRGASGQEYYDDGMVKRYEDYNAYYKGVPYAHTGLNVSGTVYTDFYGSPAVMPRVWLEAASSGKLKDALAASSGEFQKKAGYEAYAEKVRRDETAPTAIHQLYSRESQFTQFNLVNFPTSMALLPPLVPYIVGKSVLRNYQMNKQEFDALKAEKPGYTHLQHTMDKVADTYRAMSYKPQDTVYCPRGHVMKRGGSCPICGSNVKDTFRK